MSPARTGRRRNDSHISSGSIEDTNSPPPLFRARLRTDSGFGFAESPYMPEQRHRLRTESAFGMPVSPYIYSQWAPMGGGEPGPPGMFPMGGYGGHIPPPSGMPFLPPHAFPPPPPFTNYGMPMPGYPPEITNPPSAQRIRLNSLVSGQGRGQPPPGRGGSSGQAPQPVARVSHQGQPLVYGSSTTSTAGPPPPGGRGGGPTAKAAAREKASARAAAAQASIAAVGSTAGKTTVMLRNLPDGFTRDALLALLDTEHFGGKYDFAYLPVDFDTLQGLKHAFVNMISPEEAENLRSHFEGFTNWAQSSDSVCAVAWNDRQQGLSALVERYRNSPVMHDSVPDECKPIILVGGRRAAFPPPTQKIKAPKILKGKGQT